MSHAPANRVIKVLYITSGLRSGGAESALLRLLERAALGGCAPCVISLHDEGKYGSELARRGIPLYCLRLNRPSSLVTGLVRLFLIARRFRPDVIQGWMYHGNVAALLSRMFVPGSPKIIWGVRANLQSLSTDRPLTRLTIRIGALLSGLVDLIIYVSRGAEELHTRLGYCGRRVLVIPNGFDVKRFTPPSAVERMRSRVTLGFEPTRILCVHIARFHPVKDHVTFLNAAAIVAMRNPDVRFALAGGGVTLENPQLAKMIRELKLSEKIKLLGELPDCLDLLRAADFVCLSSRSEAFPNVIGEAMAMGLPCVSTDVGDVKEIVGDTGILTTPGDPHELAEALLRMASIPADERMSMGARARYRVVRRYQIDDTARAYWRAYHTLLTNV